MITSLWNIGLTSTINQNKRIIECNSINYCFSRQNDFYNLSLNKEEKEFEEKKRFINSKDKFNYWDFKYINKDLSNFPSVNLNYYKIDAYKKIIPFSYLTFALANVNYINWIIIDKDGIIKNMYNFYINKLDKYKNKDKIKKWLYSSLQLLFIDSVFRKSMYKYALLINDKKNIKKLESLFIYKREINGFKKEYVNKKTNWSIIWKIEVFNDSRKLKYGDDYSLEIVKYQQNYNKPHVLSNSRYVIEKLWKNWEFKINNVIVPNIFLLRLVVNKSYKNIKIIKWDMWPFELTINDLNKNLWNIEIKLSNRTKSIKKIKPKKWYYYLLNKETWQIISISKTKKWLLCIKDKCWFIKFNPDIIIYDFYKKRMYEWVYYNDTYLYLNPQNWEIYDDGFKKWINIPLKENNYKDKGIIKTILKYFRFK